MSALLYAVNVVFLFAVAPVLTLASVAQHRVGPLVVTDEATAERIALLEQMLRRTPGDWPGYLGLARLYDRAGAQAFSYDALRAFEQRVSPVAAQRLGLALAYLEIGRNDDGLRVVRATLAACTQRRGCALSQRARLEIVEQVAQRLSARGLDARKDAAQVERTWRSVLMPVGSSGLRTRGL